MILFFFVLDSMIFKIQNAGHVIHLNNPQDTLKAIGQYINMT